MGGIFIDNELRQIWATGIRAARAKKGITAEELAGAWNQSLSYLQKIETGTKGTERTFRELMALIRRLKKR